MENGKCIFWVLMILTLAGSLTAACHRSGASNTAVISIEHEVTPQPARVGPASITLKLAYASGRALSGALITLEGNMSHPGMGPSFGKANEVAPGKYQAPLEFTMGGDWIVLVHLTLADGQKVER